MADAKKCDRCGVYYERADMNKNIYYMRWEDGYKSDRIDLCPSCLEAMDHFLKCEPIGITFEFLCNGFKLSDQYDIECGAKHCHEHIKE